MVRPVVLVHGAWHGPWCWERVTPLLDTAGVPWVAPDLPSCARANEGAGLAEDVTAVNAALEALPGNEPAILLGHSRGGLVVSESGAHPRVGQLVYLTAFLIASGDEVGAMLGESPVLGSLLPAGEGMARPDPAKAAHIFYNDCEPADAAWAIDRCRPMFMAGEAPPPQAAWKRKPSAYVVCTIDNAIPVAGQRQMAARATSTVEWECGHSPFLNRPQLVAKLVTDLAKA